jgi:hypothetical protein
MGHSEEPEFHLLAHRRITVMIVTERRHLERVKVTPDKLRAGCIS